MVSCVTISGRGDNKTMDGLEGAESSEMEDGQSIGWQHRGCCVQECVGMGPGHSHGLSIRERESE